MKKYITVITCIMLCFIFIFTCIGYAEISDTLKITGEAFVTPPEIVYISDAVVLSQTTGEIKVIGYSGTVLSTDIFPDNNNGSLEVSVEVTVFNNTDTMYFYNGANYDKAYYDSIGLEASVSGIEIGDGIYAKESKKIVVTFKITGDGIKEFNNRILINPEFIDLTSQTPYQYFEEILNNQEHYQQLIDLMNNKSGDKSFIGNISGDKNNIEDLFDMAGNSMLGNNNTVLIKNQTLSASSSNLDNDLFEAIKDEYDIMVMYSTATSNLGGGFWSEKNDVNAVIYIKGKSEDKWTHISNTLSSEGVFFGKAGGNNYNGNIIGEIFYRNSIDSSTWTTSAATGGGEVFVNSVPITAGSSISDIIRAYLGM